MRVTFQLRHSCQATTFNAHRHTDTLAGDMLRAYDGRVVVDVPGWRYAHTVKREHVTPAGRENRWYARRFGAGSWLIRSPRRLDGTYAHYAYTSGAEALAALAGSEASRG